MEQILELRVKGSNPEEGVYIASSSFSIRSPYVNIGDDITFSCDGSQADLSVEPGYSSYEWNTGATGNEITTSGEGLYWVHVQNIWGCESRDTTEFVMFESDLFTGNLDSSDFCPDDPIHVPFGLCPAAKPCVSGFLFDEFDKQALDPVWKRIEYGGTSGTARETINNTLRVETDGGDISGYRTEFFATYRSDIEGDFEVVAKITAANFSSTSTRSFLGIVAANNFESNEVSHGRAVYAGFRQDGSGKMNLRLAGRLDNSGGNVNEWRPESGEVFYDEFQDFSVFPVYLRLRKERSGSQTTFSLSYSHDSVSWSTEATLTNDLVTENMDIGFAAAKPGEMEVDGFYTNVPGYFDTRSYEYVLQLSDKNGDFSSPINVDTLKIPGNDICAANYSGKFETIFPWVPQGSSYLVRTIQITPDGDRDTSQPSNTMIGVDYLTCMLCPKMILDSTVTPVSCFGFQDGEITIKLDETYAPYDLYWSSGDTITTYDDTLFTLTNLASGYYTLTVFEPLGCGQIDSFFIAQPDSIHIIIDELLPVGCPGDSTGSIRLSAEGGMVSDDYAFSWAHHGIDTNSLVDLTAGSYKVTVTDDRGCSLVDSFLIDEVDTLKVTVSDFSYPTIAGASNGSIEIDVTGGTPDYLYHWETLDGSGLDSEEKDQEGLTVGLYHVTVTDQRGCMDSLTYELIEPEELIVSLEHLDTIACYGDTTGVITVSVQGGVPPYDYTWESADGEDFEQEDSVLSGLTGGTYHLTVNDAYGATDVIDILINEPDPIVIDAFIGHVDCYGDDEGTLFLSVTGGYTAVIQEYSVTGPGGYEENGSNHTELLAGTYYLKYEDVIRGCIVYDTVEIEQNPQLSVQINNIQSPSCYGDADGFAEADVEGGVSPYQYVWSPLSQNGSKLENVPAGDYMLQVTDDLGCQVTEGVTIPQAPEMDIQYDQQDVLCHGDASGSVSVHINTSGTIDNNRIYDVLLGHITKSVEAGDIVKFDGLEAGDYELRVEDNRGCYQEDSISISEPQHPIDVDIVDKKLPFCKMVHDGRVELTASGGTGQLTCQWSDGEQGLIRKNLGPGDYSVSVTDDLACVAILQINLDYEQENCIEIPNAFSPNSDGVNDIWEIKNINKYYSNVTVEIYDRDGRLIYSSGNNGYNIPWDGTYEGKPLPVSSYFYVIRLDLEEPVMTGTILLIR